MRQRFTAIVAIIILALTAPIPRACAVVSQSAKVQQDCCKHNIPADSCCNSPSSLCSMSQAPVDAAPYPAQSIAPLVSPPLAAAVVYYNCLDQRSSRCLALYLPAQHAPPGLLIATTIVLRI